MVYQTAKSAMILQFDNVKSSHRYIYITFYNADQSVKAAKGNSVKNEKCLSTKENLKSLPVVFHQNKKKSINNTVILQF